jgi:hypothetical protein
MKSRIKFRNPKRHTNAWQMNNKLFLCILLFASSLQGQDSFRDTSSVAQEKMEENLIENYSEASGTSPLFEQWDNYKRNPLDINSASFDELEGVPGMPPLLAQRIVEYRKAAPFRSVRELLNVPNMTEEVFLFVKDFLSVRSYTGTKRYEGDYRQRTGRTVEQSRNFLNHHYQGNGYQIYNRVRGSIHPFLNAPQSAILAGAVLEKDPGESRLNDHQAGFLELQNFPFIKKAVLGNYQLEFGQALGLWGGAGLSKSNESIQSVKRRGRGIRRYDNTGESAALFGGAAELDLQRISFLKQFQVSVFYSHVHYDASFNADQTVNNIVVTGLHRDSSERAHRDYLLETLAGGNVSYRKGASSVGMTIYTNHYNHPFAAGDSLRDRFQFSGRRDRVVSGYYDWFFGSFNVFGEAAQDKDNHAAVNSGLQALWPGMELVLFYRHYARDFNNPHAFAFGEQNGKTQNEEGIYTGVKLRVRRGTLLQGYYDIFRYPWRSPDVPKPVTGDDLSVQADQNIWTRTNLNVLFKNQRKDQSVKTQDALGRDIVAVGPATTCRWRCQMDYQLSPEIHIRSRFEQAWYGVSGFPATKEKGNLFYEAMTLKVLENLSIHARLSFFDTQGSNSSIYEFEDDTGGLFTNARFSGKGKRWYVLAQYRWRRMQLSAKYWELYKQDVLSIGSGGDAVSGNVLRKVTVALDLNF